MECRTLDNQRFIGSDISVLLWLLFVCLFVVNRAYWGFILQNMYRNLCIWRYLDSSRRRLLLSRSMASLDDNPHEHK